jgi:hypothetical protein
MELALFIALLISKKFAISTSNPFVSLNPGVSTTNNIFDYY